MFQGSIVWKGIVYSILMIFAKGLVSLVIYFEYLATLWKKRIPRKQRTSNSLSGVTSICPGITQPPLSTPSPPHSIALLISLAMISRGEIGFLIASLSQSSGTLGLHGRDSAETSSSREEIFLVIIWAVVVCTITGPIGVGIIVRRIHQGGSEHHVGWI